MSTYKTPGVFIEEIAKLPPSIAEVETAIPAFIGYTQVTNKDANGIHPVRIGSLLEYETIFGTAAPETIEVHIYDYVDSYEDFLAGIIRGSNVWSEIPFGSSRNTMYYHMRLYFANGGGPCYIVSVGEANGFLKIADLRAGLDEIEKYDEPTLLLFPEAVNITTDEVMLAEADVKQKLAIYLSLRNIVEKLADPQPDDAEVIAMQDAQLTFELSRTQYWNTAVDVNDLNTAIVNIYGLYNDALQQAADLKDRFVIIDCYDNNPEILRNNIGTRNLAYGAAYHPFLNTGINYGSDDAHTIIYHSAGVGEGIPQGDYDSGNLVSVLNSRDGRYKDSAYNIAHNALTGFYVSLPPSAAIAGVYASVDKSRGVWKAPANVSLNLVNGLTQKISDEDQETLNVDPTGGKSINAIRSFTGKGTLVWGARTLAGNDNEWRYVSVRRFFNMVEESIKKATEAFVFEANDANTWTKIQSMIENYLAGLWKQGALQGTKPEDAFYVSIGLGKTMTAQDILEGRMYVEIGIAAVQPAEFIVLRFSHMMVAS